MTKRIPLLLYGATDFGAPHFSADILWRTHFRVPDPVFLLEEFVTPAKAGIQTPSLRARAKQSSHTALFVSSLEYGRAKKEARADEVVLINGLDDVLVFLKKRKISRVAVSPGFPHALAVTLQNHVAVTIHQDPIYPARFIKTKLEVAEIARAAQATDAAIADVRSFLKSCRVHGGWIFSPPSFRKGGARGGKVTSEMLRAHIESFLFSRGYLALGTIVACGAQAADPHCAGSGPIKPHEPIVIDVFPLSLRAPAGRGNLSHYYADCTRTLFKGEPSDEMKVMYEAVLGAQERALAMVRAGVDGAKINNSVVEYFNTAGYLTRVSGDGSYGFTPTPNLVWGFIHSLGHGVGLEIHEPPRISSWVSSQRKLGSTSLCVGNVVTIEPGLYYPKSLSLRAKRGNLHRIPVGGIRIEDLVVVKKTGHRRLSKLPKSLDWAIV